MKTYTEEAQKFWELDNAAKGKAVFNRTNDPLSGCFQEIGRDLSTTIGLALKEEISPIEAVERTLISICGYGFDSLIRDVERHDDDV